MPVIESDEKIKEILEKQKNVAVIGISADPSRPSYFVSEVLQKYGFKLYFVNPKYAGQEILGEKVYRALSEIPDQIDIVDVFRRPVDVPPVAEEAEKKGFKTFWFQPGTVNEEVVKSLSDKGYNVVVDRCMKVEAMRLLGDKDD
ncbi:CoA-binding protein [Persephonella atlantica]|uniref:CoA-binding protein n=1 Tax=Persephonella atlantica TaxID=2699429 RepID=A0ABS1GFA3_9AQUI|nr:CoA-binding protein [Persephonella atlantica]MBK3331606.1 CoA-binding protein [Persephonella atlantica]